MKRARFTEEQIIAVLKEHEAGAKTADLARKHGISETTLYNWKAKFGGMDVSEAKRLKQLEDENAKLKKLLAEQMLDAAALWELLSKKMVGPAVQRDAVAHLRAIKEPANVAACGDQWSGAVTDVDRLLAASTADRFHTNAGIAFADPMIDGQREALQLRSNRFPGWLRQQFYERTWSAPAAAALGAALNELEA
jgi:transposase-like protein